MANISQRLRREFQKASQGGIVSLAAYREGEGAGQEIKTVTQLIEEGYYPLHALYINTNNLISLFTEQVTDLPMFHRAHSLLSKAGDTYLPGYPPMSPITVSYYNGWAFYDLPIGIDNETMGGCFLSLCDMLPLNELQIEAARNLCQSRMGIYEVLGAAGAGYRLRELVTDREFEALIPSGFKSKPGDLVFIRLLPPVPECDLPWVGITTPYVLVGCREADWLEYFQRHVFSIGRWRPQRRVLRWGFCWWLV